MIRKNIKLLIGIILGIISVGGVYAVNSLNASSVTIDKTNGKLAKITGDKLNNALDYLYTKANQTNMIAIESGVRHETQTYLGIAYLDPTNLSTLCTAANSVSTTGTKTGCMKWYIYKEDSSNYYAILDHNTTAQVAWNSSNDNSYDTEITSALTTDTTGWVSSLSPRLITADEVAEITGATTQINWDGAKTTSDWYCFDSKRQDTPSDACAKLQGTSRYAWLFDNTVVCTSFGCNIADSSNWGYWTSTAYAGNGTHVWTVGRGGYLGNDPVNTEYHGIRPVITISKTLFE